MKKILCGFCRKYKKPHKFGRAVDGSMCNKCFEIRKECGWDDESWTA